MGRTLLARAPRRQAMAALWRILEVLGPAVLRLVSSPDGAHAEVEEVRLHAPDEPLAVANGDVVLAVGLSEPEAIVSLVQACGRAGAAAVACKPPASDDMTAAAAADEAGV